MKINAKIIKDLIIDRNSKDYVSIPECKTGATCRGVSIFDVWSMKKSWHRFKTIGYEVKVSRSDFLNDDKWKNYLLSCNEFYFVAPSGIIDKDEVPAEAGLIVVSKTGTRLYTKKKAQFRSIEDYHLNMVLQYVLMWRVSGICSSKEYVDPETNVEYWRKWLERKEYNERLGWDIRSKLGSKFKYIEDENIRLKNEVEKLKEVKAFLDEKKIWTGGFYSSPLDRLKKET